MRPDSYRDVVTVTVMYCAVRATGTPQTEVRSDPNAIGPTVLALALFAAGRGLLRMGAPKFVVGGGYAAVRHWHGRAGGRPVPLSVLALHGPHKLLDNEGITWLGTVVTGWCKTLDRWIDLVLLLPLATLTVLRLRSIFATEMLGMSLTAACLVLLVVL